ncbi:MAG TPA: hypothetical protein VNI54_01580 [Thermoanaerobaculia bacterium]|nr:hypothetical protein [Thermoanaerobaculia bacterium]
MTFQARTYDAIVRDMLTTLTGGTVRETVGPVPPGTLLMPKLRNHPVRRVSNIEGEIEVTVTIPDPANPAKKKSVQERRPVRFTAADFELVATSGNENDKDAIRFREKGRKPVPGSMLVVNYYPVTTEPVPLTDVNTGSVVRTLLETIGVELALTYQQLQHVYESAFVETAEGAALDRVVALVGMQRTPGGRPVAKLRFTRRSGAQGEVLIAAGTPVTDDKGNRYVTISAATMEAGESTREVTAFGDSSGTAEVDKDQLRFLEIAIAGISEVTNPEPARRLTAPETDEQLRVRARGALRSTMRGTVDAIRFGLLAVDGVKDVVVTERPNGVAGEIKVDVAYSDESDAVKAVVAARIEDLRPAGIRVIAAEAAKKSAEVSAVLTLAGASLPTADVDAIHASVEAKLREALQAIVPGGAVRRAQLTALVLADTRIVDAGIDVTSDGAELTSLPEGTVLEVKGIEITSSFENAAGAPAITSSVSVTLPLHLAGATTQAAAQATIESKLDAHMATRTSAAPLTFDSLANAIRNDAQFALVRPEGLITIESQGTFRQIADTAGQQYVPQATEKLVRGPVVLEVRGTI